MFYKCSRHIKQSTDSVYLKKKKPSTFLVTQFNSNPPSHCQAKSNISGRFWFLPYPWDGDKGPGEIYTVPWSVNWGSKEPSRCLQHSSRCCLAASLRDNRQLCLDIVWNHFFLEVLLPPQGLSLENRKLASWTHHSVCSHCLLFTLLPSALR